jgi:hypothetical protein
MEKLSLNRKQKAVLWTAAVIGLFGINGAFLYFIAFRPEIVMNTIGNIFAMVFMVEAIILLALLCYLFAIAKLKSPNWVVFLVLSLLGSLAFSIPFCILLWSREKK